jgi:PAS domain S-box-containing protein
MNAHYCSTKTHDAARTPLSRQVGLALISWRATVPVWFCLVAGVAMAALAWGMRLVIFGVTDKIAYVTFFPIVAVAALLGPPALGATTALASAAIVLNFVAPVQGSADLSAMSIFLLDSALNIGLAEFMVRIWADAMTQKARARELEELKSAIVDSSDDVILTKTLDGRITSWNPAAKRIFGYLPEEIVGEQVTRLFPPDLIAEESAIIAELLANERARHYQTKRVTKDGRTLDVALTISPLRDAEGRVIGASKILRDITLQKQSEEALRVSGERLRFALEGARAAAWQWDCPDMTSAWPPHFFCMHGINAAVDLPSFAKWLQSVVVEDRAQAERDVNAALTSGAPDYRSEYRVRAPDGGLRWIEVFGRVERDETDAPLRISGISLDVSDRHAAWDAAKAANLELARANESLKHFTCIAAHDLKAPLRKIQQFADLLSADFAGEISTDAVRYLAVMRDASERMRVLINNLLDLSQAANRELATAPINANALMERVVNSCAAAIAETRAEVRIAPLPPLRGDETLVEQLFVNLLTNALKYRRPGVSLQIAMTAVEEKGGAVVRFSDNGLGIGLDDHVRVFEPFVRLHQAEGDTGAGIGLAICQTICKRHGWRLSLESEPGAGTTFSVAIPAERNEWRDAA